MKRHHILIVAVFAAICCLAACEMTFAGEKISPAKEESFVSVVSVVEIESSADKADKPSKETSTSIPDESSSFADTDTSAGLPSQQTQPEISAAEVSADLAKAAENESAKKHLESANQQTSVGEASEQKAANQQTSVGEVSEQKSANQQTSVGEASEQKAAEKAVLEAEAKSLPVRDRLPSGTAYARLLKPFQISDNVTLSEGCILWVNLEDSPDDCYMAEQGMSGGGKQGAFNLPVPKEYLWPVTTEVANLAVNEHWGFDPINVRSPLRVVEHRYDDSSPVGYAQVVTDDFFVTTCNQKVVPLPKGTIIMVTTNSKISWYANGEATLSSDGYRMIAYDDPIDFWAEPSAGLMKSSRSYRLYAGDILHQPEDAKWATIGSNEVFGLSLDPPYFTSPGFIMVWDYDELPDQIFICDSYQDGSHALWTSSEGVFIFDKNPSEYELEKLIQTTTNFIIYS